MSRLIDNLLADYTGDRKCLTMNETFGSSTVLPPGHVWKSHPGYGTPNKSIARRRSLLGRKAAGIKIGKL